MEQPTGRKSTFAAVVMAMSTVLATVADISGVMRLREVPTLVLIATLGVAAMVLAVYALASRRRHGATASSWLAAGALLCAVVSLGVMVVTTVRAPKEVAGASTEPTRSSLSMPSSQKEHPPVFAGDVKLWLGMGVDVDVSTPKAIKTSAVTGSTDIAVLYYGSLQASGKGMYHMQPGEGTEATCRAVIASGQPAEKEVLSVAGREYCMQTSAGNSMWLQIVESTLTSLQVSPSDHYVVVNVKVWPK